MNEKLAQLLEKVKANKGTVIRVAGVLTGALIGVAVASMIVAAQEAEFESDDLLALETDEESDEDVTE